MQCGGRIFFPRESPGHMPRQEVWLDTITIVANAVARESAARIFFIFSPLTAVAVDRAAGCGTQRASSDSAHISTCQADLSPANLSCPGV